MENPNDADNSAPAQRLAWWDERVLGYIVPQPDELVAFAALNFPADIWLSTPEALSRVAEAYIAHSRKLGYWAHSKSHNPFHASGARGYRDRLKEYKAVQAWLLSRPDGAQAVSAAPSEYSIRFSHARWKRGLKGFGLFQRIDAGFSKCVSDHATREEAEQAFVAAMPGANAKAA